MKYIIIIGALFWFSDVSANPKARNAVVYAVYESVVVVQLQHHKVVCEYVRPLRKGDKVRAWVRIDSDGNFKCRGVM